MYIHFSRDHILSIADFAVQQVLTVSVHCSHMRTAMLPLGPDHLESNILKITGKISISNCRKWRGHPPFSIFESLPNTYIQHTNT